MNQPTHEFSSTIQGLLDQLERSLLGKRKELSYALSCLLADGHLLIEDVPGVGKTTMARSLANCFHAKFTRVQFTSDLLPSDLIGVTIYRAAKEDFSFQAGPVFTNVLLADEINRANPKTQSALLEAMHENQVSHDGKTFNLPDPFFVIATQNSKDHHGTFPLPEAQLDRFLMRLHLGYPLKKFELEVIRGRLDSISDYSLLPLETLKSMRTKRQEIFVSDEIVNYIYEIINRTRNHDQVSVGVSPRGAQALYASAQAYALVQGRSFCTPDDILELAPLVCCHRLLVKRSTEFTRGQDFAHQVMADILSSIPQPAG